MKYPIRLILLIVPAITVFVMFGCNLFSTTQEGPCEGSLTLENPIPDTTVAVGDKIYINLSGPPVFESTEDRITYAYNISSGITHVDLAVFTGYKNEIKIDSLEILGNEPGDSIIQLFAKSGCLENSTTFNITVTAQ